MALVDFAGLRYCKELVFTPLQKVKLLYLIMRCNAKGSCELIDANARVEKYRK